MAIVMMVLEQPKNGVRDGDRCRLIMAAYFNCIFVELTRPYTTMGGIRNIVSIS